MHKVTNATREWLHFWHEFEGRGMKAIQTCPCTRLITIVLPSVVNVTIFILDIPQVYKSSSNCNPCSRHVWYSDSDDEAFWIWTCRTLLLTFSGGPFTKRHSSPTTCAKCALDHAFDTFVDHQNLHLHSGGKKNIFSVIPWSIYDHLQMILTNPWAIHCQISHFMRKL